MDRRQFIKGVCGVFAAVVLPIPKVAAKAAKLTCSTTLTLLEVAKRMSNKHLLNITKVLSETNEFLSDAKWVEK